MKIIKYTHYLYLAFAAVFLYDGVEKATSGGEGYPLSFFIAAVCVFMFFFRRNFLKKLENRNKGK